MNGLPLGVVRIGAPKGDSGDEKTQRGEDRPEIDLYWHSATLGAGRNPSAPSSPSKTNRAPEAPMARELYPGRRRSESRLFPVHKLFSTIVHFLLALDKRL